MSVSLKGLAVAAAGIVATVIGFTAPAATASTPYYPQSSVSCYLGDPNGQPGAFVSAGTGHFTFTSAKPTCTGATTGHGTYLYFQNIAKQGTQAANVAFNIQGVTQPEPGTHFKWAWLNRVLVFDVEGAGATVPTWHSHCPNPSLLKSLSVSCKRGYF